MIRKRSWQITALCVAWAAAAAAEERTQSFDRDPGWHGHNNRVVKSRAVRQDFGYSATTSHAGGTPGEIGGFITPAAEPAFYAKKIPTKTFNDGLSASGRLIVGARGNLDDGSGHTLITFFNSRTLNEWRTPNTIALRVSGRGKVFFAWVEYCTSRWRAGGDSPRSFPMVRDERTGRQVFKGFATGVPHAWSLRYDPNANNGSGVITATIDDMTAVCNLDTGHRSDGATFDRFGLLNVMKHADDGGELWLDDVTVNADAAGVRGERDDFSRDPRWDARNHRRAYESSDVRPRFDFGYSRTRHAGGKAAGEVGGLLFRGDCRYPDRMACYGDRLATLTLERPLVARGKVSLHRGVTDSTILIGFYHSEDSMQSNPSQQFGLPKNFLGVAIEGPSREGFLFYPIYRVAGDGQGNAVGAQPPYIYPDGKSHDWTFDYSPAAAEGRGRITVMLDGKSVTLDLPHSDKRAFRGHRATGARFDRFGFVTTWIDGNGQRVYLDELTYTCKQE